MLVLYGDVPLIGAASLKKLVDLAAGGALAVLSVELDDAAGYGRIVRDARGQVGAIVEHKDASAAQLAVREVNTGLMAAPAGLLRDGCLASAETTRSANIISPTWSPWPCGTSIASRRCPARTPMRSWA